MNYYLTSLSFIREPWKFKFDFWSSVEKLASVSEVFFQFVSEPWKNSLSQ